MRSNTRSQPGVTFPLLLLLCACSWTHRFRVENVGREPAVITYELDDTGYDAFFRDHALVYSANDTQRVAMDPSTRTITFVLQPGASAELAEAFNTSYTWVHEHPDGIPRDNLAWMTVRIDDMLWRYDHGELHAALAVSRNGISVLRVGGAPGDQNSPAR